MMKTYTITAAEDLYGAPFYEGKTFKGFKKITYAKQEAYEGVDDDGLEIIFLLSELKKIDEE